jgi:hypothetical protein
VARSAQPALSRDDRRELRRVSQQETDASEEGVVQAVAARVDSTLPDAIGRLTAEEAGAAPPALDKARTCACSVAV